MKFLVALSSLLAIVVAKPGVLSPNTYTSSVVAPHATSYSTFAGAAPLVAGHAAYAAHGLLPHHAPAVVAHHAPLAHTAYAAPAVAHHAALHHTAYAAPIPHHAALHHTAYAAPAVAHHAALHHTAYAAPIAHHPALAHTAYAAPAAVAHHASLTAHPGLAKSVAHTAYAAPGLVAHHAALKTPVVHAANVVAPAVHGVVAAPAALAYSAPALAVEKTQYHGQDVLGQASYGHAEAFQHHDAVQDAHGNKVGSFSWVAPDGQVVASKYVADALGYRVHSNALPVGPAPVLDTVDVAAARAAHVAAHIAVKKAHHIL